MRSWEATALALDGRASQRPQCCFGPGAIDPLHRTLRLGAERGRVGDLIAVTVCGDNQGASTPLFALAPAGRDLTECLGPGFLGAEGGVEDGGGSGFDELAVLG